MIKLGDTVKCKLTGWKGVAEAETKYLNGCHQILVRPKAKSTDKEYPKAAWIDVENLDLIKTAKRIKPNKREKDPPSGGLRYRPRLHILRKKQK